MPFAWWELILILLVLLLVFGAKRLPEMGRSLGKGMREFKESVTGMDDDRPEPRASELPAASEPYQSYPPETATEPVAREPRSDGTSSEQPERESVR